MAPGIGIWTPYSPVLTSDGGAVGFSAVYGSYAVSGSTVFLRLSYTTDGSGGTNIVITLPFRYAEDTQLYGTTFTGMDVTAGKALVGTLAGNDKVLIYNYDGTFPGTLGDSCYLTGFYKKQ